MKYKKKLSPEFKTQVALDAIRESMPLAEIGGTCKTLCLQVV